jgi:acetolactate synthase I/II/III large subunit
MPKGADVLVAALENEGVDRIFGVPGEENLDVVESLRKSKIKLILTRHEQAAAFMAATHGRLTGRPGVCISTLGPGALNLSTGAAYAHFGAMPMIMLTGQKAIKTAKQARFQIVDVIASMRPLTKMARQIVNPGSIPAIVRDAFRVAMEERPGPVHLELPEDVAGEETAEVPPVPPHPIELPVAPPAALDRAAEMICMARRPLTMLGAGSSRPKLVEPLSSFVRRTRIPFFNTQMGKGSVTGGSNLDAPAVPHIESSFGAGSAAHGIAHELVAVGAVRDLELATVGERSTFARRAGKCGRSPTSTGEGGLRLSGTHGRAP